MDNDRLHNNLDSIDVPRQLEIRIRQNWQQQLQDERRKTRGKLRLAVATLALVFATVVSRSFVSTPALITAALDDIDTDAKRSIGIAVPLDSILTSNQIQAPIKDMPLRMTKYCNLGETKTVHMHIAGANQGEVHLFVNHGRFDHRFWQDSQGKVNNMSWRLIHPRDDLDVLVIFTPDMNPLNVERLVRQMFYS